MKITEKHIQAILMKYCLNAKNHEALITNSREIVYWEADLLSWTRSFRLHEFEVKLNIHDYRADFKKKHKHMHLNHPTGKRVPNYFWYVTCNFFIRPPERFGWIYIHAENDEFKMYVNKEAPLLHKNKMPQSYIDKKLRRALSFRLMNNISSNGVGEKEIYCYNKHSKSPKARILYRL